MPPFTVGLSCVQSCVADSRKHVLFIGDKPKVLGIAAFSIPANMIDYHVDIYIIIGKIIGQPMGRNSFTV